MAQKNVLIVARTRMYGAKVCVGALSDQGEYVRLMNRSCESDHLGGHPKPANEGRLKTGQRR